VVARDRLLAAGVACVAVVMLFATAVNVAEVFFLRDVVRTSAAVYGFVTCAWAVGMLAGARFAGRLQAPPAALHAVATGGIGLGAALLLAMAVPNPVVNAVAWLIGGAANAYQNVSLQYLVAVRLAEGVRGRAFAFVGSVVNLATLVGITLGAPLTSLVGPRGAVGAAGAGALLGGVSALLFFRRKRTAATP
jgi:hypothetical protein